MQRQLYYDQGNISHIVTKVWWEGQQLKGEVESANTQRGKDFKGLIEQGSKVAFSLRAIGPVVEKQGDHVIVKDPLTMFCYDWVIHPSHPCAYMDSLVQESYNHGSMIKSESGIFMPINESAIDYAKTASRNFNLIVKSFDIDRTNVQLTEGARGLVVNLNESNDRMVITLEETLQKEINNFYSKFY